MTASATAAPPVAAAPDAAAEAPKIKPLWEAEHLPDGGVNLKFSFHAGQARAWQSTARFTWMLAGTQGGKTSFQPLWMWREMQRKGPGDYIAATATFPLLGNKLLPEFMRLFRDTLHLGEYRAVPKIFEIDGNRAALVFQDGRWRDEKSRIIFGSGINPQGLESATAKAAVEDECGQDDFKLESHEAIRRRLSIHQGRILAGTTIYNLGWLKQQVYDRWKNGDPEHNVVVFPSIQNPAFPRAEYESARRSMPAWKFAMYYRGEYSQPAGLIYESYVDEYAPHGHKIRAFPIPPAWPCRVGIDFGAVNLALVWLAKDPNAVSPYAPDKPGVYYVYRERHGASLPPPGAGAALAVQRVQARRGGALSSKEHANLARRLSARERIVGWHGGAKSEEQQRADWLAAGVRVQEPPFHDVESGIDKVIELFQTWRLFVFDGCAGTRDELGSYRREVDEFGETLEKIHDKDRYHRLDALRYVVAGASAPGQRAALAQAAVPRGWGL